MNRNCCLDSGEFALDLLAKESSVSVVVVVVSAFDDITVEPWGSFSLVWMDCYVQRTTPASFTYSGHRPCNGTADASDTSYRPPTGVTRWQTHPSPKPRHNSHLFFDIQKFNENSKLK